MKLLHCILCVLMFRHLRNNIAIANLKFIVFVAVSKQENDELQNSEHNIFHLYAAAIIYNIISVRKCRLSLDVGNTEP